MSVFNDYITESQFGGILDALNIELDADIDQQDILDRATGDLESELVERFVVPLVPDSGGAFSTAPSYARLKVLSALRAAIRRTIGQDKNVNIVVESTERYIDLHDKAFKDHVKTLLDPKKHYGFKMQTQADGAIDPIQSIGLARADNGPHIVPDRSVDF